MNALSLIYQKQKAMTTKHNYIAELHSGFELVIEAKNMAMARHLAQRAAFNDRVVSIRKIK